MSNIFLQKHKNINNTFNKHKLIALNKKNNKNKLGYTKHFPPANKEWNNSIYAYNENNIKLLPAYDKMVIKLIKSYFYLYNPKRGEKVRSRRFRIRLKRLSTNRIFVSKAEVKHTNAKVIITLYIYNGQLRYFINKLKNISFLKKNNKNSKKSIFKRKREIKKANKIFLSKIRLIKYQSLRIIQQVKKEKALLTKTIKLEKENDNIKKHEISYYENFVKKLLKKEMLILYYKRLLYFNLSKFENTFILPLTNIISKIYRSNVEFNLVNLKYLHLNSDILSESIATKLRKRKNRLLTVLRYCLNIVKIPVMKNEKYSFNNINETNRLFNVNYFYKDESKKPNDMLDQLLRQVFSQQEKQEQNTENRNINYVKNININRKVNTSTNYLETSVLNLIKHKLINGVRIEASGRLSKRFTAARSLFKFKYKGSLKNIDSSYKNLPSVMLRNHVKSNIQYSKKTSKTRNGSFGIKGWISSK